MRIRAFLVVALLAPSAWADAVPPKPYDCPRGRIAITSHAGPQCVLPAPTDCPAGYRGETGPDGPRCAFDLCSPAATFRVDTCKDGLVCTQQNLCYESQMRGYAVSDPRHQPPGPPRLVDVPIGICSASATCDVKPGCKPAMLCLPPVTAAEQPKAFSPKKAGCGGCAVSRSEGAGAAIVLATFGAVAALLRRRRC